MARERRLAVKRLQRILLELTGIDAGLPCPAAVLFGLGYGVSYPILVAMAANDAQEDLGPQTLQLFALTYFVGIFGFPFIAGWIIVEIGTTPLLVLVAVIAAFEASMALNDIGERRIVKSLGG